MHVEGRGVRVPLARSRVAALARRVLVAEGARDAFVSIAFVGDREMATMNREHLRHAGATDVLSFGFAAPGGRGRARRGPVIGDIYIAPAVARENARRLGLAVREELARLVVHGILHVLGYDHPEGPGRTRSRMWRRQEQHVRSALGEYRS